MITGSVEFQANGYACSAYTARPERGGPGVIVLHAWWGLTPFFKRLCERLAEQGYVAFAPDLYGGLTAQTIEQAEQALDSSDAAYARSAVLTSVEQIKALPGVKPGKLGVIGFSMGAAWAVRLSTARPEEIAAVVLFYGAEISDFSAAQATYLGHFADPDDWEPIEWIRKMEQDLRVAGREVVFHFYPGAGHWFFEDDRPDAFQPQSAALAWGRTLDFLGSRLGG
jgi:carboxymethylenebutenolidase